MASGTILILVGPEYEDLEVWYPKLRLEEAGYTVPLAGLGDPSYRGKHGYPCKVDGNAREWAADELAGIIAPGGWAPDKLRRKGADLLVANDVAEAGSGFGSDTNRVVILGADGTRDELPLLTKREVAERLLDRVASMLDARGAPAHTGATIRESP